jgi:hypothetical protein
MSYGRYSNYARERFTPVLPHSAKNVTGRFQGEADMNRQARLAALVENDPYATWLMPATALSRL